ncbi:MAG: electron transfer flavoprotein subunit alpha/FixB family protein, partial [Pseudomonadota bacterium]
MSRVLIVAEHDGENLNASTAKCVTCAQAMGADGVDIAVFSEGGDITTQAAALTGVEKVLSIATSDHQEKMAATLAPMITTLAESYSHILGPSTTFGKDLMPRVAALLGVPQVSDIMDVLGTYSFKRPIYAGNAIVTVEAPSEQTLVATVRTASYAATAEGGSAAIEEHNFTADLPSHTRYGGLETSGGTDRPDLQTAAKVVSGGRALGSSENFDIIYALAEKMGAGVGASRAAVDAGYVPNDMQVGQTGKIISPD